MSSKEEIIQELQYFIQSQGFAGSNLGLYIGITDNPSRRLFLEHGIDELSNDWAYCKCSTVNVAREIEAILLELYKAKGDKGGGNEKSVYVYVCRNPKR